MQNGGRGEGEEKWENLEADVKVSVRRCFVSDCVWWHSLETYIHNSKSGKFSFIF